MASTGNLAFQDKTLTIACTFDLKEYAEDLLENNESLKMKINTIKTSNNGMVCPVSIRLLAGESPVVVTARRPRSRHPVLQTVLRSGVPKWCIPQ